MNASRSVHHARLIWRLHLPSFHKIRRCLSEESCYLVSHAAHKASSKFRTPNSGCSNFGIPLIKILQYLWKEGRRSRQDDPVGPATSGAFWGRNFFWRQQSVDDNSGPQKYDYRKQQLKSTLRRLIKLL
jgi:hypothetical protein